MSSNQYDANTGELKPFSGTPINEITSINAKIAKESDKYSDQAIYEVGDLCIYDNKLYKCIEAVTTAGSWETNSSKFERESLIHYSNELNSDLTNLYVSASHNITVDLTSQDVTSFTVNKSGFYIFKLVPTSSTSVYGFINDSTTMLYAIYSVNGGNDARLVYLRANTTYYVNKSTTGITRLAIF